MWRFKFSAWVVVLLMAAFSFGACDNDDDDTFVPPSNITEALKQVYPAAQNIEWEMKGAYYVADCWVSNDELEVWFDANANWVMTENELNSIDQLVPAVYTDYFYKRNGPLLFIITFVCNLWPILLHLFLYRVTVGRVRFVSLLVLLCRKRHGAYHR